jgi:hypothetical protein|tara:strand:+ start:454 stop:615 length:162 start_codon:yes stop_codon:yes gene_type:complete
VVEEKWVQKKEELERKIRRNKLNSVPKHAFKHVLEEFGSSFMRYRQATFTPQV